MHLENLKCHIWNVLCLVCLFVPQYGYCAGGDDGLANWLVGVIAVCAFLVLTFVFMLVNHYLCANMFIEEEYDDEENDDARVTEEDGLNRNGELSRNSSLSTHHQYAEIQEKAKATPNIYVNPEFDTKEEGSEMTTAL